MDAAVDPDAMLILAYARGDLAAFEAIHARHRGMLYWFLLRSVRDAHRIDELFQETWSRVISAHARYQSQAKFSTWLLQIAHNLMIDSAPRQRAVASGDEAEVALTNVAVPEQQQPDHAMSAFERLRTLQRAIEPWPEEQRIAAPLRPEQELSLEEIAAVTGAGRETVKSRLLCHDPITRSAVRMTTPLPPQEPGAPDEQLPGEAELAALYRQLLQSEPGPALDAAVLRAATQTPSPDEKTPTVLHERRKAERERGDWVHPKAIPSTPPVSPVAAGRRRKSRWLIAPPELPKQRPPRMVVAQLQASAAAPNSADTPAQELDKIQQLFAQRRDNQARQRLEAFHHLHPTWDLPPELRARLRQP